MRGARVAAVALLALGLSTVRVVVSGERELRSSTAALERGDPRAATVHARRAAGWFAPGAPHVAVAYDRLRALARGAEEHRRRDVALFAWQAIRSAAIETRWLVPVHAADRALADREIARLLATSPNPSGLPGEPDEQVAAKLLGAGDEALRPRLAWVLLLVGSFGLGVAGMLTWAHQLGAALPVGGSMLAWRELMARCRLGLALTAVAIALWLLALWQA